MALEAPTSFTAALDTTTNTSIDLTWTRPASIPDGARTIISQGGRAIHTIMENNILTYTVEDLTPGTTPAFTIHFEIAASEPTPPSNGPIPIPLPVVPAIASASTENSISLTWERPSNLPVEASVVIRRGNMPARAVTIHKSTTTTKYVDRDNIRDGETYVYNLHFEFNNAAGPATPETVTASS